MKRKIYIGVDVSKNWLDLAYYDGVEIDWKSGHIRVDNNKSGYRRCLTENSHVGNILFPRWE